MPSSTCCGPAASGRHCRRTCRPAARSGSIWTCGSGTARSAAFTTPCTLSAGDGGSRGEPDHSPHRQPKRQGSPQRGASLDASGYDVGKRVLGRKRHILTDTLGLLLAVIVHPAYVQDRDGAEELLREARRLFPFIERVIGDAGYQGPKMAAAVAGTGAWTLEIVRRRDRQRFVALPKRWIVVCSRPCPSTPFRLLQLEHRVAAGSWLFPRSAFVAAAPCASGRG